MSYFFASFGANHLQEGFLRDLDSQRIPGEAPKKSNAIYHHPKGHQPAECDFAHQGIPRKAPNKSSQSPKAVTFVDPISMRSLCRPPLAWRSVTLQRQAAVPCLRWACMKPMLCHCRGTHAYMNTLMCRYMYVYTGFYMPYTYMFAY